MSFYVADESLRLANRWLASYDFRNMDYGSEELNEYAKTFPEEWYGDAYLIPNDRPSFSNSSKIWFRFRYPDGVSYIIRFHYKKNYPSEYSIMRNDKVLPGRFTSEDALYNRLMELFPKELVGKLVAKCLKQFLEDSKEREKKDKEERRRRYEYIKRALEKDPDWERSDDSNYYMTMAGYKRELQQLEKEFS